mmetsp:Transcript_6536/g.13961  ORF Transcript_6536/g.13961 Transcript_6536/m.13961 type:complete len:211 (+) Transcript_6536:195-827(+)
MSLVPCLDLRDVPKSFVHARKVRIRIREVGGNSIESTRFDLRDHAIQTHVRNGNLISGRKPASNKLVQSVQVSWKGILNQRLAKRQLLLLVLLRKRCSEGRPQIVNTIAKLIDLERGLKIFRVQPTKTPCISQNRVALRGYHSINLKHRQRSERKRRLPLHKPGRSNSFILKFHSANCKREPNWLSTTLKAKVRQFQLRCSGVRHAVFKS